MLAHTNNTAMRVARLSALKTRKHSQTAVSPSFNRAHQCEIVGTNIVFQSGAMFGASCAIKGAQDRLCLHDLVDF